MNIISRLKNFDIREVPPVYRKVMSAASSFGICCHVIMQPLVAASTEEEYAEFANSFYVQIMAAATVLGIFMVVALLVMCICTKQPKKLETYITWIKCIVVAYVALATVGVVWKVGKEFLDKGFTDGDLNPLGFL